MGREDTYAAPSTIFLASTNAISMLHGDSKYKHHHRRRLSMKRLPAFLQRRLPFPMRQPAPTWSHVAWNGPHTGVFLVLPHHLTVGQNNQKYRLKYWVPRSSVCSIARNAHSFACSALLALLARSTAITRSLTSLTPELMGQ